MQYTRLGTSGLKVSRIALGCMSFGDTSRVFSQWALDDAGAEPIFRQALELGITFWDTANVYGFGTSEAIVDGPRGASPPGHDTAGTRAALSLPCARTRPRASA